MANTGYKQATIAYKTTPDGRPVDVDGRLTSVSGKRQAIALLIGRNNPNVSAYEVELYFNPGGTIWGVSSVTLDISACPVGFYEITPLYITLTPENNTAEITVNSSYEWQILNELPYFTVSLAFGFPGVTIVEVKGTTIEGQGSLIFRNLQTGQLISVQIANTFTTDWILADGIWGNLELWKNDGIWNY